jgi:hypothetical protein
LEAIMGRGFGESIAVLDGFDLSNISVSPDDSDGRIGQIRAGAVGMDFAAYDASPDDADGRIGQTRAFPNQYARSVAPGVLRKLNMIQASNGANYAGGSSWYPGAPTMPASIGLADGYGRAGLGDGYGRAGLGDGYGRAGLGGCTSCSGSMADADLSAAFEAYAPSPDDADGRIGQTRAFPNEYATPVGPGVLMKRNMIQASGGANYMGGSSYAPEMPFMTSSIGLAGDADMAADPELAAYMNASNPDMPNVTYRNNVIDPSGGANYGGGSSFSPGMPLLVSSAGLAELRGTDALDSNENFPMLATDAIPLFRQIAGKAVLKNLRTHFRVAQARRHPSDMARYARQFAIARRIRRAVRGARSMVTLAALNELAKGQAVQVASAPTVQVNPAAIPATPTAPVMPWMMNRATY